jgi:hypothetical protein
MVRRLGRACGERVGCGESVVIEVGDKILLLVTGPHGVGLVRAFVECVHAGVNPVFDTTNLFTQRIDSEGVTWIRGHDLDSPAARALLVAGTLGR